MKKDYCKDFIILLCVIGIIGCIVAITKLDSRLDNVENINMNNKAVILHLKLLVYLIVSLSWFVCVPRSSLLARNTQNAQNNKLYWL